MKRFWLALTLFVLTLLCACSGGDVPAETTAAPEMPLPPTPPVVIAGDGRSDYAIIRPENGDAAEIDAAVHLFKAIGEATGAAPALTTDWVKNEADIPTDTPEILVGATNRAESADFAEGLLAEDYVIAVSGRRVVILGGTPAKTAEAVDVFIERYLTGTTLSLPADLHISSVGHYAATISIAGNSAADYCIVIPKSADRYLTYAADLLAEAVEEACGATLDVVSDSEPASDREIRLGRTARGGESPFAVSFDGASLCLGQAADDSADVVRIVRGLIECSFTDLADGTAISFTADSEVHCSLTENETPTHPSLAGKRAVALADQLNAEVAVIDLDAADPTAESALLWSWSPSTTLGFSAEGYDHSIDEAKLRYDAINDRFLVCVTSSAGFMGVAAYPEGECVWNGTAKIGPHSIEWLPNGNVAVALSGNSNTENGCIRIYAASQGKTSNVYAEAKLVSAHGVVWDEALGVLWALGADTVHAYRIGGTDAAPTITEVVSLRAKMPHGGGHDLQPDPNDPDVLWVSGKNVLRFDKRTGKFDAAFDVAETVNASSIKAFGSFADGTMVRSVATKVYKDHDTDTLVWFVPDAAGKLVKKTAQFPGRAFYKARIWCAEMGR